MKSEGPATPGGPGRPADPGRRATRAHDHGESIDPELFSEASWDQRYESRDALWSGKPNGQLVAEAADLTVGTALDVGCGEGADAIWLAERGWRVTAVDISGVALQRAAAHAGKVGAEVAARIEWLHADLRTADPGPARFDLVSAQYMHLPSAIRIALFARLAAAVAPGGTLLIVGHHPSDLQTTVPRPPAPDLFFIGDDVAASLDTSQWTIITNAAPARTATDPDGNTVVIHDTVLRAQRHG
jgi:SAM-dependent methyltransferase